MAPIAVLHIRGALASQGHIPYRNFILLCPCASKKLCDTTKGQSPYRRSGWGGSREGKRRGGVCGCCLRVGHRQTQSGFSPSRSPRS